MSKREAPEQYYVGSDMKLLTGFNTARQFYLAKKGLLKPCFQVSGTGVGSRKVYGYIEMVEGYIATKIWILKQADKIMAFIRKELPKYHEKGKDVSMPAIHIDYIGKKVHSIGYTENDNLSEIDLRVCIPLPRYCKEASKKIAAIRRRAYERRA